MNRQMATPVPCSEERTNFFRVCRVVLDHIPKVLRAIFKDRVQRRHKHTWDDSSDSGTKWLHVKYPRVFSSLYPDQENLLKGGQTKEWDPTLLFHVLMSSALRLLLDEIPGATVSVQKKVTVVSVPSGSQVPAGASAGHRICIDNGKKCVYGEVANVSSAQIVLTQTVTIKPSGAKVYVCTPEFEAVDRLRGIRNVYYGHVASATTPTVELDSVLARVKQAYIELARSEAEIESLVAIKTEAILDKDTADYQRRFDEFYKQSQDYEQRFEELEFKQKATNQATEVCAEELEATKQQVANNTQDIEDGREERQALREELNTLKQAQGISVASSNMDSQPTPTDQPPMLDTDYAVAMIQPRGRGNSSRSSPSHLSLDTAMLTTAPTSGHGKKEITSEDFEVFNMQPPKLYELCDAAAEIADLYDQIGMGLGLTHGRLRIIRADTAGRPNQMQLCLTEVFSYWGSGRTLPYTWETFASVLLQPRLAPETELILENLHKKLTTKTKAVTTIERGSHFLVPEQPASSHGMAGEVTKLQVTADGLSQPTLQTRDQAVVSHHTIPDPPTPYGLDPTEPQDSADGSPHDPGATLACISATQEAQRKLAMKSFLEGLQSRSSAVTECDYVSKLEQYFKLKGIPSPNIHYRTKDHHGYRSTVTAPGMGSLPGEVCWSREAAEQNAALHMLQKIQKYAD